MVKQKLITPDGDLSERELKFGYFFVKHKLLLKKIFIGLFILFDVLLVAYATYGYVRYYIEPIGQEEFAEVEFVKQLPPSDIKILETQTISLGNQKYDLISEASNPNSEWIVGFDYYFVFPGGQTEERKEFILPGETKFLTELGFNSSRSLSQVSLQFKNILWKRIDKHEVPDYQTFYNQRFNFEINDVEFHSAQELGLDTISRASFNIKNNTAYNYWGVSVHVILYRGSKIVGINHILLDQFSSGESRDINVAFYEKLPLINKVEVLPAVNIFDPDVYMDIQSDGGEIK